MSALAVVAPLDRRTYIGGSDIAAVMGLDPWRTPYDVYLEKKGEREGITDPQKLKFLARRKRWEGPIVQMLREEFDGEIVSVNERYTDEEHDFLAAEIDFEWRDADGSIQNGEVKTVSPFAFNENAGWGDQGTDQIPIHYHAQTMHGLGIKRRRVCVVAAMAGLDTMAFYRVERDDETIAAMRGAAVAFWNNHVLAGVPPEPTTLGDVQHLFANRRGRPVELDAVTAKALQDLRDLRAQKKALAGDEEELELAIALYVARTWGLEAPDEAADNAALIFNGAQLATWAAGRGAHLDQKRLKAEHPEIVAAYTQPHFFRSFRFKKGTP